MLWGANAKDQAEPVRVEQAFTAIITKDQFSKVGKLMRSRAPKRSHPRRVGSTYLLSGLVKCKACGRALSGQDAKSGQFSYYVCQSIMKRGKDACDTPRLNARRFEEMVVGKIRSNVLTDGNIRALVKVVDEQMDGVAREQRKRLETIEDELEDVKRKLGRIWHFIETSDTVMADASDRIKEHEERQERLEDAAADARAMLSQRRKVLDDVNTIAAYAKEMRDFLDQSELSERRAFIKSFVKEIVVVPGDALLRYTVPMPDNSLIPGGAAETVALPGSVLPTLHVGGPGTTMKQGGWRRRPRPRRARRAFGPGRGPGLVARAGPAGRWGWPWWPGWPWRAPGASEAGGRDSGGTGLRPDPRRSLYGPHRAQFFSRRGLETRFSPRTGSTRLDARRADPRQPGAPGAALDGPASPVAARPRAAAVRPVAAGWPLVLAQRPDGRGHCRRLWTAERGPVVRCPAHPRGRRGAGRPRQARSRRGH